MNRCQRLSNDLINYYNFDDNKDYTYITHIDLSENKNSYDYEDVNSYSVELLANLIEFEIPTFKCSRLYLYYNERVLLSSNNYNCLLKLAIDNLKNYGACSDTDWNYNLNNIDVNPLIECYQKAKTKCSFDFINIYNDIDTIKKSLINNEPILTSINIYADISNITIINLPKPNKNKTIIDSPIILIYGYDDSKNMFLIKIKNKKYYVPYLYFVTNDYCYDLWIMKIRYYNIDLTTQTPATANFFHHPDVNNIKSIDLRSNFGPVFDQGKLGSCSANALCAIFDYDLSDFIGSRLFLYYNERKLDNDIPHDSGSTLDNGIEILKKYGICSENDWNYDITKFAMQPPDSCYEIAKTNYVIDAINIKNDLITIKSCLINNEPIALGIQIYNSFETTLVSSTGYVPLPSSTDILLGGHAVVLCGYDDNKKIFILRNSWGTYWGDKGYFYLDYDYILNNNLTSQLWIIRKAYSAHHLL
jgi:C1A family cysteine protease